MSESDKTAPTPNRRSAAEGILERLAFESLKEQRRARRWGIFFKLLLVGYVTVALALALGYQFEPRLGTHTAVVDIDGVIAASGDVDADSVVEGLRAAFESDDSAGVIIRINSPGGSPVQAGYINTEIKRLRTLYPDKPLYAVVTDMCASGGYYVAAAADKIFVDRASIVGSIGVLIDGFGFVGTMDKLGVERRLITAGKFKGMLDPFSPVEPDANAHVQALVNKIHEQFIDIVREGRGERLVDDPDLFTGLFWTGEQALALGLADALGSTAQVARDVIGAEELIDYTAQDDLFERFAQQVGVAFARTLGTEALTRTFTLR